MNVVVILVISHVSSALLVCGYFVQLTPQYEGILPTLRRFAPPPPLLQTKSFGVSHHARHRAFTRSLVRCMAERPLSEYNNAWLKKNSKKKSALEEALETIGKYMELFERQSKIVGAIEYSLGMKEEDLLNVEIKDPVADVNETMIRSAFGRQDTQTIAAAYRYIREKVGTSTDKADVGAMKREIERALKKLQDDRAKESMRIAPVTLGVKDELLQQSDLIQFQRRVDDLFRWYHDKTIPEKYIGPYFPIIQSSGIGKTKLFFALASSAASTNQTVLTILCLNGGVVEKSVSDDFDKLLDVPQSTSDEARKAVCAKLDGFLETSDPRQVVLLFDESQNLMGSEAWPFRVVRWWLRKKQHMKDKEVVAVFAGTTQQLSQQYQEAPESTTSRDAGSIYYEDGDVVMDPFFSICTFGVHTRNHTFMESLRDKSEFEKSLPYGRPLFATMLQKQGAITVLQEQNILRRITLSQDDWRNNTLSCLSLLTSRIQLGEVIVPNVADELVTSGYAYLVEYENGRATIGSMTDPMCARLAMAVMTDGYNGEEVKQSKAHGGLSDSFWTKQASKAVNAGLTLPSKGDVGEVGLGLYMLMCGDKLRLRIDQSLRTYSVPLDCLLSQMQNPWSNDTIISSESMKGPRVSFIQITRQFLRFRNLAQSLLFDALFLEDMYTSGGASFMPPNFEGVDVFGSVKYFMDEERYCPLLIQFKAQEKMSFKSVCAALEKLEIVLDGKFGIGLLMICSSSEEDMTKFDNALKEMTGISDITVATQGRQFEDFGKETKPILLLVKIPKDDPFGVTKYVEEAAFISRRSEVVLSHDKVRMLARRGLVADDDRGLLLRANARKSSNESIVLNRLFDDFSSKKNSTREL